MGSPGHKGLERGPSASAQIPLSMSLPWKQHTSVFYPEPPGSQFEPLSIRGLIFNGFYSMADKSVRERWGAGNT